jgi:hypothetical protein
MPLFSGIYKRGAGFGPAISFLYAAPAINVFVIVLALKVLGIEIGMTWAICSVLFAYSLGLLMSLIFRGEIQTNGQGAFSGAVVEDSEGKSLWQQFVLFVTLIALLDLLSSGYWLASGILSLFLIAFLWRYFTKDELLQWLKDTLNLIKILLPWFLIGVFVSSLIVALVPGWLVVPYVGGNDLLACFVAGFLGTLMEFCSLSLVPVAKAFIMLGMGKGPSLALLLTGSAISIPGILIIRRIMGLKKTAVYAALVFTLASLSGYFFGMFFP